MDTGTHGVMDTKFGNIMLRYENGRVEGPGVDAENDGDAASSPPSSSSMLRLLERDFLAGHCKSRTEHEHMPALLGVKSRMAGDASANALVRKAFRAGGRARRRGFQSAANLGLGGVFKLPSDDNNRGGEGMDERRREADAARARESGEGTFQGREVGDIWAEARGGCGSGG